MQKDNLPAGFISVQDAIKLIESDSRKVTKKELSVHLRSSKFWPIITGIYNHGKAYHACISRFHGG